MWDIEDRGKHRSVAVRSLNARACAMEFRAGRLNINLPLDAPIVTAFTSFAGDSFADEALFAHSDISHDFLFGLTHVEVSSPFCIIRVYSGVLQSFKGEGIPSAEYVASLVCFCTPELQFRLLVT